MKSWKLNNGYTIYQLLEGRANVYLVFTGATYILVDTGTKWSNRKLMSRLNAFDIKLNQLKYLVLTHTHFDHCGNAKQIADQYRPAVIVHASEAAYLEQAFSPLPSGSNMLTSLISKLGNSIKRMFRFNRLQADILVEHSLHFFKNGLDIQLIHTPGHSEGSISVIINQEIAIAGDTLFGVFNGSVMPLFLNDKSSLLQSMRKLLKYKCRLYLPGHGREISFQQLEKEYRKHALKN